MDPTTQSVELLLGLAMFLLFSFYLSRTAFRIGNVERQIKETNRLLGETNRLLQQVSDFVHHHETEAG